MEALIYLDTHVAVWLYEGRLERFPAKVITAFEKNELLISPMAVLELQYLFETERITVPAKKIIHELSASIGLTECRQPFGLVVSHALAIAWTRDPFDRLITAQAMAGNAVLISKDLAIRRHYKNAQWD
jgi:PIN domain nuclease of toxin-antitoxin system